MLFIIFTPKDIFSPFLHSFFLLNEMEKKEREKNMERQKRKKTRKKITAKISLNSILDSGWLKLLYFKQQEICSPWLQHKAPTHDRHWAQ